MERKLSCWFLMISAIAEFRKRSVTKEHVKCCKWMYLGGCNEGVVRLIVDVVPGPA
jgi:hypothetical protein